MGDFKSGCSLQGVCNRKDPRINFGTECPSIKTKTKNRKVKKPVAKIDFQTDFSALVRNYKETI